MRVALQTRSFQMNVLVFGGLLWAALIIEATEFIQYSRNVLLKNGRWVNSKTLMQMDVMAANHFLFTRNALHRNRLNLGAWHGFNEVHLNDLAQPAQIEYRFQLAPDAYIYFIFNRNETGHDGIRVSRNLRFPSMVYRADRTNRFVERTPLGLPPTRLDGGWHDLRLSFSSNQVTANLDGDTLATMPVGLAGQQILGLRSGWSPADLDSVLILGRGGETILYESFSNRQRYWTVMLSVMGISLVPIILGAIPFLRRTTAAQVRLAAFRWLVALGVTLVLLSLIFGFDYSFWSSRYLYKPNYLPGDARPSRAAVLFESLRGKVFGANSDLAANTRRVRAFPVRKEIRQSITQWDGAGAMVSGTIPRYRGALVPEFLSDEDLRRLLRKISPTIRVAFLGTSQTWGAGAEIISETFVARTHALLATGEGASLETYNFSIPGSSSGQLLGSYMELWRFARPDLLVVNLSNNDRDAETLTRNLRALADVTRHDGGRIVFVLEPNSSEPDRRQHLRNYAAIQKLGDELSVPVWDLEAYLSGTDIYDSGMLWWDNVHLTSYGQSVTAGWLANRITPLLRSVNPVTRSQADPPALPPRRRLESTRSSRYAVR